MAILLAWSHISCAQSIYYPGGSLGGAIGNVGIGGLPSEKLTIHGIANTAPGTLSLESSREDAQNVEVGRISAKNSTVETSRISLFRAGGSYTGYMAFYTKPANGTGITEVMRLDSTGNLGIGTPDPTSILHVVGPAGPQLKIGHDASNWMSFSVGPTAGATLTFNNDARIYQSAQTAGLIFKTNNGPIALHTDNTESNPRIYITGDGKVGIGTQSPGASLDVRAPTNGGLIAAFGTPAAPRIQIFDELNSSQGPRIHSNAGYPFVVSAGGNILLQPASGVAIGASDPGTHKLAVNGTGKFKEVIVETTGWSDYVLAPDYKLISLAEVEAHIREHQHLPGLPSAGEVAEQGISVGEMHAKLLAKIEELTLHVIAQQKRIEELEAKVSDD